jgi:hypothetical protein
MSIDDEMSEKPWLIPPSGRVKIPEITGPLPSSIKLNLSNLFYIEKKDLLLSLSNHIFHGKGYFSSMQDVYTVCMIIKRK